MLNKLNKEEELVIKNKSTEHPFTGEYDDFFVEGEYICKQCNTTLFSSNDKFNSGCGWPSFDDEIPNTVEKVPDTDGKRTEIICANCKGHLGHIFEGEKLTKKDKRYCVNSISLRFIPKVSSTPIATIYLGGGCFWCTEAVFKLIPGVKNVSVGYSGGSKENPTYEEVCMGKTGHIEVTKVEYENNNATLQKILTVFFKTHDPTTPNRQGNDIGEQYKSAIFYTTLEQRDVSANAINQIKNAVTELRPFIKFYPAEKYHQNFYANNPNYPYCNIVIDPKIKKVEELLKN